MVIKTLVFMQKQEHYTKYLSNIDTKIKLFVTRVNNKGDFLMSKPCEHCQYFLKKEGVKFKNVWYTNQKGQWINLQQEEKNEYYKTKRHSNDYR